MEMLCNAGIFVLQLDLIKIKVSGVLFLLVDIFCPSGTLKSLFNCSCVLLTTIKLVVLDLDCMLKSPGEPPQTLKSISVRGPVMGLGAAWHQVQRSPGDASAGVSSTDLNCGRPAKGGVEEVVVRVNTWRTLPDLHLQDELDMAR